MGVASIPASSVSASVCESTKRHGDLIGMGGVQRSGSGYSILVQVPPPNINIAKSQTHCLNTANQVHKQDIPYRYRTGISQSHDPSTLSPPLVSRN